MAKVRTVDGEIIRVSSSGAALPQLSRGRRIGVDRIRAKEAVHMADILTRRDDRVDILEHKLIDCSDGVGTGKPSCQ